MHNTVGNTLTAMKNAALFRGCKIWAWFILLSIVIGLLSALFSGSLQIRLGHYIEKLPNGLSSVSHGGQGNGIMTHFQAVPETGDAIVILTNSQRSWPFIAYVLSDWAVWRAFPTVGMGKIIWGHYGLCAVIGMLISASSMVLLRLIVGFHRQKRTLFRVLRAGTAVILLGVLVLCGFQEYLFVASVFPVLSVWLGGSVLGFSIALLLSALLPARSDTKWRKAIG